MGLALIISALAVKGGSRKGSTFLFFLRASESRLKVPAVLAIYRITAWENGYPAGFPHFLFTRRKIDITRDILISRSLYFGPLFKQRFDTSGENASRCHGDGSPLNSRRQTQ